MKSVVKNLDKSLSRSPAPVLGKWACRLPTIYEADLDEQQMIDSCAEFALRWGEPHEIGEDSQRSAAVMDKMADGSRHERHRILVWLMPSLGQIACTREGCRVAQKAVEVALGGDRKVLVEHLQPHIAELYKSPFGNFVLSKVVEMMPSALLCCIVEEFRGRASVVARHRYGCRILERLVEHCTEQQIAGLLDEIVADAERLARHSYGNFVVQRVLEHGGPKRVVGIIHQLPGQMAVLAKHRFASHVVAYALESSDEAGQAMLVAALLDDCDLVSVACSRFGALVVERLADLPMSRDLVKQRLGGGLQILQASRYGRRVMDAFNLTVAIESGLND